MIKLIILDVDGILTDGKISYSSNGDEIKNFNVKDGLGIKMAQKAGIEIAIISGRNSIPTAIRAKELDIKEVHQGIKNKKEIFHLILKKLNIKQEETAFIGDDYNDLQLLKEVGFSATVADAPDLLKKNTNLQINKNGGNGAVRDFIEEILKRNGQWKDIINTFL
jgi:3-deoxy-D-manno-octulosonate 8-phosphate phosphatase (KDO 8-P phosphatase)